MAEVPGLTKRCLAIQQGKSHSYHKVIQYHYTNWPDFGVPKSPKPLVDLVKIVREELASKGGVCVVHCSAGVGRTGTMIALNKIIEEIDNETEDIDIFRIVLLLRTDRMFMVQKPAQYNFLYACTAYYLTYGGMQTMEGCRPCE